MDGSDKGRKPREPREAKETQLVFWGGDQQVEPLQSLLMDRRLQTGLRHETWIIDGTKDDGGEVSGVGLLTITYAEQTGRAHVIGSVSARYSLEWSEESVWEFLARRMEDLGLMQGELFFTWRVGEIDCSWDW